MAGKMPPKKMPMKAMPKGMPPKGMPPKQMTGMQKMIADMKKMHPKGKG